jgi:hypothetical protein
MMTMKKKIYPRISTQLPAVLTSEEGIRLKVIALDTSQYGFTFQCSTYQRNSLTPGGCFIHNGRPVELEVLLDLPFPDQYLQIKARCHVAFSRRIASEKCEIGIRYEEFDADGYKYLTKFIETKSTMAPTPRVPPPKPLLSPAQVYA